MPSDQTVSSRHGDNDTATTKPVFRLRPIPEIPETDLKLTNPNQPGPDGDSPTPGTGHSVPDAAYSTADRILRTLPIPGSDGFAPLIKKDITYPEL